MEAFCDLPRLRCARSCTLSVETAAVTTDDLDLRMPAQPVRCPNGRPIRQHIGDLPLLQVHHDRAVAASLAPAPVVYSRHPNRRGGLLSGGMTLRMTQDGIVAGGQAEAIH